jgi:hypothetical protein
LLLLLLTPAATVAPTSAVPSTPASHLHRHPAAHLLTLVVPSANKRWC